LKRTILVPIKGQNQAKTRMSVLLSAEERSGLAWAMFIDLTRALQPVLEDKALVTNSRQAADYAKGQGWRVLWETSQITESLSVDSASRLLASEGVEAVLRLPADLPLIGTEDIDLVLGAELSCNMAILVPSRDGLGTNAILRSPPNLFPSRFGHNSLKMHVQEAQRVGAGIEVIENPNIALDLDEPSDIASFMACGIENETSRFLTFLRILERIH
jgi:2-phospho-L-lactate guanylyltransferase